MSTLLLSIPIILQGFSSTVVLVKTRNPNSRRRFPRRRYRFAIGSHREFMNLFETLRIDDLAAGPIPQRDLFGFPTTMRDNAVARDKSCLTDLQARFFQFSQCLIAIEIPYYCTITRTRNDQLIAVWMQSS